MVAAFFLVLSASCKLEKRIVIFTVPIYLVELDIEPQGRCKGTGAVGRHGYVFERTMHEISISIISTHTTLQWKSSADIF